jgi:hypothetical protein
MYNRGLSARLQSRAHAQLAMRSSIYARVPRDVRSVEPTKMADKKNDRADGSKKDHADKVDPPKKDTPGPKPVKPDSSKTKAALKAFGFQGGEKPPAAKIPKKPCATMTSTDTGEGEGTQLLALNVNNEFDDSMHMRSPLENRSRMSPSRERRRGRGRGRPWGQSWDSSQFAPPPPGLVHQWQAYYDGWTPDYQSSFGDWNYGGDGGQDDQNYDDGYDSYNYGYQEEDYPENETGDHPDHQDPDDNEETPNVDTRDDAEAVENISAPMEPDGDDMLKAH